MGHNEEMTDECSLCLFCLVQMCEYLWGKKKGKQNCLWHGAESVNVLCANESSGRGGVTCWAGWWLVGAALTGDSAHSELLGQPLEPSGTEPVGHTGPPEWTWALMSSSQEASVALGSIPTQTRGKVALSPPWVTACWIFTYGQLVFLYWWKMI